MCDSCNRGGGGWSMIRLSVGVTLSKRWPNTNSERCRLTDALRLLDEIYRG